MFNQSYFINQRALTQTSSLADELTLNNSENYYFDLSNLGIIHVQGEQAHEFLQGQLTCDINELNSNTMQLGALCNLKGRIISMMDVIKRQSLQLILEQDLMAVTIKSLQKAALFSKVKLAPLVDSYVYGLYVPNQAAWQSQAFALPQTVHGMACHEHYCCYHIIDHLYILISSSNECLNARKRGALAWHKLKLHHKLISIYPETSGLFLPHRLGLQNLGYLNFNKGCYRGQEIIARTHFRATLKQDMKLFTIKSSEKPYSGQKLLSTEEHNRELGIIVDYCPLGKETYLIATSILVDHPVVAVLEGPLKTRCHLNPMEAI